jgi:hypothetical protein
MKNMGSLRLFYSRYAAMLLSKAPGKEVRTMMRRNLLIALLSATALVGTALAQKSATPKQPTTDALAEENVKGLLLIMDTDKNGKISKQEWMKFMEGEFDRLDKTVQEKQGVAVAISPSHSQPSLRSGFKRQ